MSGGRSSQRKGRKGELELVGFLRERGMTDARPGAALNYGTEPDIVGIPGVHVEVKRCEKLRIPQWYAQSKRDAEKMSDGVPVVAFRQSRQSWMIVLSLADFLDLAGNTMLIPTERP